MSEFWNEVYSQNPDAYGQKPNQFFASCLQTLQPGTLLLPGEGTGRNALFAARLGWEVIAFDASEVAVQLAQHRAEQENLSVSFYHNTYELFPLGYLSVNALAFIFTHQDNSVRRAMHHRFIECLTPGGALIAEYYHQDQLPLGTGGPKDLNMLYRLDDLQGDFPDVEWTICDHSTVEMSEGSLHQGLSSVIRLFGRKRI